MDRAVRHWGRRLAADHSEVVRVGYFGSYARGDWGPGSDVDLIVIVRASGEPFERRTARWDTTLLLVPADLLVYTEEECDAGSGLGHRVRRRITRVSG